MPAEDLEPKLIIEKLTQAHSLAEFECSNATLDTWLKRYAWTNQRAETSKTYVAHRGGRVLGYHALVAGSVLKHEAPERIAQGLANHPVGVILFARLPVTRANTAKGLERHSFETRLRGSAKPPMSSASGQCWSTPSTIRRDNSTCTTDSSRPL